MNKKLEEFEKHIERKKVAIIGLGVSNIPLLKYMYERMARVTVFDNREMDEIPKDYLAEVMEYEFDYEFGKDALSKLHGYDIIFRSPSCMPTINELVEAEKKRS